MHSRCPGGISPSCGFLARVVTSAKATMADRIGIRAVTMQQPYAAAMIHGQGLYSRRGKAFRFADGGEWVAIHCGQSNEHLKNSTLMAAVREHWPGCPSDDELRAHQKCIIGLAKFVDGDVNAAVAAKDDFYLAGYDCSKPVAWRASSARSTTRPFSYPKGQLQVWHVCRGGFADGADADSLLAMAREDGAALGGPSRPPERGWRVKRENEIGVKREAGGAAPSAPEAKAAKLEKNEPIAVPAIAEPIMPPEPAVMPAFAPAVAPAFEPTFMPAVEPAVVPAFVPAFVPAVAPAVEPTFMPAVEPAAMPAAAPAVIEPAFMSAVEPAVMPAVEPYVEPYVEPAVMPAAAPAVEPAMMPAVEHVQEDTHTAALANAALAFM